MSNPVTTMRAAWFERPGPAREVLLVGTMPVPEPGPGEVRVRVYVSCVNPGDTKKRQGVFGPLPFARIIPNSDGAGVIDKLGPGVTEFQVGNRVWVFNAQSGRPFGTAAEYTIIPAAYAVHLPSDVDFLTGAGLGIPARTAHRVVFAAGPVTGKWVLVAGAGGSVGSFAVQFAKWGGARVIATAGNDDQARLAQAIGVDSVINFRSQSVVNEVMRLTGGEGVNHIAEVAFDQNLANDVQVLAMSGSIATYSTSSPRPVIDYWPLVGKNAAIYFVGVDSDDRLQRLAVDDITAALRAGLLRSNVGLRVPLDRIAEAHEHVDEGRPGKAMIEIFT